jgi:hypothetical protein
MFKTSSEFARASDEAKSALLAALTRRTYANNEVVYLQGASSAERRETASVRRPGYVATGGNGPP